MGKRLDESKFIDKRFGILTVQYRIENSKPTKWHCICDCGNETDTQQKYLKKIKSCGCLRDMETSKRIRKYTCNDSFFSVPNPQNSYWAGFIAADGCIEEKSKRLRIKLALADEIILKEFKKQIEFSGNFYKETHIKRGKVCYSTKINITSKQLITDLNNNFNITTKKSLTLKPPINLNKECTEAFIRGFIDGDGSFCITKSRPNKLGTRQYLILSIVGTYDVLLWIQNYINSMTNVGGLGSLGKRNLIWVLQYSIYKAAYVYKNLCPNPIFKLERKWEKFDNIPGIFDYYNKKRDNR
jgi:hypothetical protein